MILAMWNVQGCRTKKADVFKKSEESKIDLWMLTKAKGNGNEEIQEYICIYRVSKVNRAKRSL